VWHSRVHNDGPLVPSELLSHAFEPLVTTKHGHAGTGLSVAHRVMSDHGGSVSIENTPSRGEPDPGGVTITISLPRAREG
jgi:nitrogen-specific signal transduction histidine kinase